VVEVTERAADGVVDVPAIRSLDFDRLTDDCGGEEEPFQSAFMVAGHVGYSLIAPLHGFPHTGDDLAEAVETARGAVYAMAVSHHEPDDKRARFYDTDTLLAVYRQHMADAAAQFAERQAAEQAGQCSLLRCLFGPLPFRPVPIDPAWRTPAVLALTNTIYEERRWDEMPVLGDVLSEAGCRDAEILGHCRGPGPHTRGCWVCDFLLQKECREA
jgi:hypothetical protein